MAGNETDYEALAQRLTDPDTPVRGAGAPLRGAAASEAGKAFLLREYGSEEALNEALRPGRPKLGTKTARGDSPTVRGRVSQEKYELIAKLGSQTGVAQSELVREALDLLLAQHHMLPASETTKKRKPSRTKKTTATA